MKKIYFLLLMIALFSSALVKATKFQIHVTDHGFIPIDFTVNVGDTLLWIWDAGIHTTTSTTTPSDAPTWSAPVDADHATFQYAVMQPGIYTYQCNHYQAGMTGRFNAVRSTGINETEAGMFLKVKADPGTDELKVELNTTKSGMLNLGLYNIIGRQIKELASSEQSAGLYQFTYPVADLAKGIYLVRLSIADMDIVRKVIIE